MTVDWDDPDGRWNDLSAFAALYEPYPHQLEGFYKAAWENTIVILPTGTGKTLISAMVIDLFSTVQSLTLFAVNNVALVNQQTKYLSRVCRSPWATVVTSHDAWQVEGGGVIVGTGGALLRLLPDLPLDRLGVIVFDEVHHATGDHPYVQIMRLLRECCPANPRIVGLTASWLHGELRDLEAKRYSLQMTVGATICTPAIADECVNKAKFKRISYPDERPELELSLQVQAWITNVTASLHPMLSAAFGSQAKKATALEAGLGQAGLTLFPRALCEIIDAQLHAKANHAGEIEVAEAAKEALLELPGAKNLLGVCGDAWWDAEAPASAKAKVLLSLLEGRAGRILVFVEQVVFALPLAVMLSTHLGEPVLHVSGTVTMRRENRNAHVEAFRAGHCRILVCTAALEEGLDVPDCDCVIRYDSFSNVKSHVQGAGRARQIGSEVLYFDNSPDEEDQRLAAMMNAATDSQLAASTQLLSLQPGTGEGHMWGPETTIWDKRENKSFRGQECITCGAYLHITSRVFGQGGKKKERFHSVEGSYVCLGYRAQTDCLSSIPNDDEQYMGADSALSAIRPDTSASLSGQGAPELPNSGQGHQWSLEDTIWDVKANASFRGHSCASCGATLRITVRAFGRGRKKKERAYALEGPEVCPACT